MRTRVKICCISSLEEARLAVSLGADALGLVGPMPSGPGVLDDATIQSIARVVAPPVGRFLLTSRTSADAVVEHALASGVDTVQLVDAVAPDTYAALRSRAPHVRVVQVLHVEGPEVVEEATRLAPLVDALLLDSGRPNAAVRELGGTGRVHDWRWSRAVVDAVPCPVFLAGGLSADNARRAIDEVAPFGLDVCSGVRTAGALDEEKLRALMAILS
ncbi:MAG: phosphoribosylanthranilate isomerase [Myxococcales bacterium]|nr:phosphoribosylanthranilate isomerase [Myxococcales bacterium]